MPERLKAILDKITAWWKKFNTKQRSVLISIVAVVIVALVILGVVISRPTQVELVEAQSASEASTIKGVLEDNNISYEVDSKLVFFVNKSDEVNAIMALGDNGIPAQAYSIDNIIEAKGNQFKETLLRVVYAAVRITPAHSASRNLTVVEKKAGAIVNKHKAAGSNKIVAIASSTGGPKALQSVIPFLPAELLAPVVLVQHMPAGFTKSMAERLNELSQVQVKEASNGEVLKNGVVYIAPGGTHIAIKKSGASHVISFNDMPPISGLKPCANIMFDSLTSSNYDEVVCVVLTGMGADGTNGILSLGKSKPIYVIAQDEKSSVVYGMPRAIYEAGVVDEVVTLSDVAKAITKNVGVK